MSMGHAYVLPGDGKPQPVEVRTGLSDGKWERIAQRCSEKGDEVIVGTRTHAQQGQSRAGGRPACRFRQRQSACRAQGFDRNRGAQQNLCDG